MDVSLYRNFIIIIESGSLSQAAQILHIAQPALSYQLKTLQSKYGSELIKTRKGKRQLEITPEGQILYEKALHLIAIEKEINSDIKAYQSGLEGTLRLTLSPSLAANLIHTYLAPFKRQYPHVAYDIQEVSTSMQASQLLSGISEIGIANAPIHRPEYFKIHSVLKDQLALVINKNELTQNSVLENILQLKNIERFTMVNNKSIYHSLSLDKLCKIIPLLTLCLSRGCQETVKSFCSNQGLTMKPFNISTTKTAALSWVRENCGSSIIPLRINEIIDSQLLVFFLPQYYFSHAQTVYTVKNQSLSPLAKKFLNTLHMDTSPI